MLTAILFALLGIALGQFIKVEVDPKMIGLLDTGIAQARTKALPVAAAAAAKIKSVAAKTVKASAKPEPAISIVEFKEDDFEGTK
jgi:hypothetical protein